MFRDRARRLHFVGIGGVGMSGIAEVLHTLNFDVRGSDLRESPTTARLRAMGVRVAIGHAAAHVADADVVVVSSAVDRSNPEVAASIARGIPVIRRAEMLAELMRLKYGIAVAGTHGKTTTTSLIATILDRGGIDPTIVIGGRLKSIHAGARLGEGEYLVAEADESDGSFLRLVPTIAVVTNIDQDHLDHWRGGLPELVEAFVDFVHKVPFYGAAIVCLDHPTVQALLPRLGQRVVTYGFSPQADFVASDAVAEGGAMHFDVHRRGVRLGRAKVGLVGRHNVQNALASLAVADEVGVPFATAAAALADFAGIGRRFEAKGTVHDVMVVDDYGHHPAEIAATLEAALLAHPRRLVVLFEPHRYSRTRDLLDAFASCFNACHVLMLTDIYAAGEAPIVGIDGARLADVVRAHGHRDVTYVGSVTAAAAALHRVVRRGDLVLTLGAGQVGGAGEELLARLAQEGLVA